MLMDEEISQLNFREWAKYIMQQPSYFRDVWIILQMFELYYKMLAKIPTHCSNVYLNYSILGGLSL